MQTQFVRYIRIWGTSLGLCLAVVAAVNWVIDPYNELGKNWIGVYTPDDRQRIKSVVSFPHDAILMGSSRTMHIDPNDLCKYKFYNASFPSALPEEMYYFLEKYAKNEKLVAIGLDFYMFNETSSALLNLDQWKDRYWSTPEYLLGWDVFMDSLKAIYIREYLQQGRPANGFYSLTDSEKPDMVAYQWYLNDFVDHEYVDYHLSETRLEYMRKIKQLLDSRHIKCMVFINPMQEDHWKALHLSGSYDIFFQWIGRLREIFPDVRYFPEGVYSQKELYKNDDPSHYLPVLGAMFMNDLLGCGSN